jgi:hypothetical protein
VIMMQTGNIEGAQALLAQIAARQAEKGQQPQDTQGMGVLAAAAAAATLVSNSGAPSIARTRQP